MDSTNGLVNSNGATSSSRNGNPPSLFGLHRFENGSEAHTFINTALNRGSGYTGAVALATDMQPPSRYTPLDSRNAADFDPFGLTNIMIHPITTALPAYRSRPQPASAMIVIAKIEPTSGGGNADCFSGRHPSSSGTPSNSPSSQSQSSNYSERSWGQENRRCDNPHCSNCHQCNCHLYCSRHALVRCPVHGLGLESSDDASLISFGSGSSSFDSSD